MKRLLIAFASAAMLLMTPLVSAQEQEESNGFGLGAPVDSIEDQVEAWNVGAVNGRDRGFVHLPMPDKRWVAEDCELGMDWIPENRFVFMRIFWRENKKDHPREWKTFCRRWFSTHPTTGSTPDNINTPTTNMPWNEQGTVWRHDIPDRLIRKGQLFIQFRVEGPHGSSAPGISMGKVFGGLYGREVQ